MPHSRLLTYRLLVVGVLFGAAMTTSAQTSLLRESSSNVVAGPNCQDAKVLNDQGVTEVGLRHYEEAINAFKRAVTVNPDFAVAHFNLGEVYGVIGRHAEALAAYRRALEVKPDYHRAHARICQTDIALGRNDEAVSCYDSLLRLAPLDAATRSNYGCVLDLTGRYGKAIAILEETIRIYPDSVFARINLAASLFHARRKDEAVLALRQALELDPNSEEARFSLGVAYLASGDRVSAGAQYEILKRISPSRAGQLYELMARGRLLMVKPN